MRVPPLGDADLAYETGFHIGDGCLSLYQGQYRYVLSGNGRTESEFYSETIAPLLTGLYGLRPRVSRYRNSIYATIYSKELLLFKSNIVGLPVGTKDTLIHLPDAILGQGKRCRAKLLAGLYDADGSLKKRVTSSGSYPRLSFTQKTKGIVEDIKRILFEDFEITSTMYYNDYLDRRVNKLERRWFLDINGFANLRRYMDSVGTRHPSIEGKAGLLLCPPFDEPP